MEKCWVWPNQIRKPDVNDLRLFLFCEVNNVFGVMVKHSPLLNIEESKDTKAPFAACHFNRF